MRKWGVTGVAAAALLVLTSASEVGAKNARVLQTPTAADPDTAAQVDAPATAPEPAANDFTGAATDSDLTLPELKRRPTRLHRQAAWSGHRRRHSAASDPTADAPKIAAAATSAPDPGTTAVPRTDPVPATAGAPPLNPVACVLFKSCASRDATPALENASDSGARLAYPAADPAAAVAMRPGLTNRHNTMAADDARRSAAMHDLVARHAAENGVPFELADAVIRIESRYNSGVVHAGNYGLMQIRAQTARGMGFSGTPAALLDPDVNLRFGMKYLGQAYRLAGGDTCRTVMRYQSGLAASRFSAANRSYCARARSFMAGL